MSQIYIGIDNGLDGGLVALSDHQGPPIGMIAMPVMSKAKGREVDARGVADWIFGFDCKSMTVTLETPGKFSKGVLSICSMWDSYGVIRAILETRGIRHHRIAPSVWQSKMLIGCAKGGTKPAALAVARRLWPDESWTKSERCKKPHDGIIDAAIIAEYSRILKL
jgi:hypothetical protein